MWIHVSDRGAIDNALANAAYGLSAATLTEWGDILKIIDLTEARLASTGVPVSDWGWTRIKASKVDDMELAGDDRKVPGVSVALAYEEPEGWFMFSCSQFRFRPGRIPVITIQIDTPQYVRTWDYIDRAARRMTLAKMYRLNA